MAFLRRPRIGPARTRRLRRTPAAAIGLALASLLGACGGSSHSALTPRWREGPALSAPAGLGVDVTGLLAPAAAGDAWVAAGAGRGGPTGLAPLWWTSQDGITWRAGAVHPITADGPRSGLVGVARTGETVAAVGQAYSPIHGNARPLAWRADARGALTEVSVLRELFGGENGLGLVGITAAGGRFTAAGGYVVDRKGGGSFVAATVWTSAEGEGWSRTQGPAAPASAADEIVVARGVTSGGGKRVLFGDSSPIAGDRGRPAVWCATDDGPWQRLPTAAIAASPAVTTVLRAGSYSPRVGFVIAGIESEPSGAHPTGVAFTSLDCVQWHRRRLPGPTGSVTILDAGGIGAGVVVSWQDAAGLHLTAVDPHGVHAVTVPVGGAVEGAHVAGTGTLVVAVVSVAGEARAFSASS